MYIDTSKYGINVMTNIIMNFSLPGSLLIFNRDKNLCLMFLFGFICDVMRLVCDVLYAVITESHVPSRTKLLTRESVNVASKLQISENALF
jgi:hypothetical protein